MIRPDKRQRDRARDLRKNLTDAERLVWQELRRKQLGVKFRRQAPVGAYIADFLSHDAMLVIEVDGGHHGETQEYDAKRTEFIEAQGFTVLRFWNAEIFENLDGVLTMVKSHLDKNIHPPHPTLPRKQGRALASGQTDAPNVARAILRKGAWENPAGEILLSYDDRFLRRKSLTISTGDTLLIDLPQTTSLNHGDAFELTDGRLIKIIAAKELLIEIKGDDLVRLAWHIGNRHTPCQIEPDRLLIQHDHVIHDMLAQLGAILRDVSEPFTPEGGAYGHGRTHGHAH